MGSGNVHRRWQHNLTNVLKITELHVLRWSTVFRVRHRSNGNKIAQTCPPLARTCSWWPGPRLLQALCFLPSATHTQGPPPRGWKPESPPQPPAGSPCPCLPHAAPEPLPPAPPAPGAPCSPGPSGALGSGVPFPPPVPRPSHTCSLLPAATSCAAVRALVPAAPDRAPHLQGGTSGLASCSL